MNRILWGMFSGLAMAGIAVAGELPTKDEVLNRFAEAVGGQEVFLERSEMCFEGTIVQDLSWTNPQHSETPFKACSDSEGQVRYVESGDWEDLPQVDSGEPRLKLRWIMHPRFPLVVEDYFPDLEVAGREFRDGRSVVVLAPEGMDLGNYALYFDEATGLLNHIGYHNDLKDWVEVDGVLFPHSFVFGRKGGHSTYRFERVVGKR